ncbi:MAG: hypothetical protein AAF447_02075 [Myxococcota bacterium]
MTSLRVSLFVFLASLAFACGDDDGTPSDPDQGPRVDLGEDGAVADAGEDLGGGSSMCPAGACDLRTGMSCAAEEACYFVEGAGGEPAAPRCAPAGAVASGGTCAQPQDCAPGLACVAADGGNFCAPACCSAGPADCAAGEICRGFVDAGDASLGFGYCDTPDNCDLVLQDDCGAGEICVAVSIDLEGNSDGSADCVPAPADAVEAGGACGGPLPGCGGGLVCVQLAGAESSTCERYCDPAAAMGTPGSCPLDFACTGRLNGFPPTVGFCLAATTT